VTEALCDASVVVKWFHSSGESELAAARTILDAHVDGLLSALLLDLTMYELGNVAVRALGLTSERAAALLDRLELICERPLALSPAARHEAVELAQAEALTFYDAAYWAVARRRGVELVTADGALLSAGAGCSPTDFVAAHGL
jgi:predicted nucleic acid-binding protein